jgi:hypothetical protein
MALRVLAVLIATLGVVVIAASLFNPSVVRVSSEAARPCLLSSERCLDLSAAPVAPCSISVERCRQDWRAEALRSPAAGRAIQVPRESRLGR